MNEITTNDVRMWKEAVDRHGPWMTVDFFEEAISRAKNDLYKKIDDLIVQTLIIRGFNEIADTYTTTKFPRVRMERHHNVDLYYADDGTPDGAFIIAIYPFKYDYKDQQVSFSFNYSTQIPLMYKKDKP